MEAVTAYCYHSLRRRGIRDLTRESRYLDAPPTVIKKCALVSKRTEILKERNSRRAGMSSFTRIRHP